MNQDESIVNLYARFNKYRVLHPFEVSENIIVKVDDLYQDLMFQKDNSEFRVSHEAKEKLFTQTCKLFLTRSKIAGVLDIKINDDQFWKERKLTIDLDICELTINADKQLVLNLRQYTTKDLGQDNKRCKFSISHKYDQLHIMFAANNKEYIHQWFNYVQQCVNDNTQRKRSTVEVMSIKPMTKQINFELLKQLDKRNNQLNMYHSQEIQQQKHDSIMCNQDVPSDPQSPMIMGSLNNLSDIDKKIIKQEALILLHQVEMGESQQLLPTKDMQKIIQQEYNVAELPEFFAELQPQLNYQFLTDESNFVLFQFLDAVRIMQNKQDPYNFRVFLPLNESDSPSLVQGLFDCNTQTKWNKQIKSIEQIMMISKTQAKIKETRQSLGYFYQPRTFNYLRLFHYGKNELYIIDKSDDNTSAKIYWHICAIFAEHGIPKLLVIDTKTINGGYITQYQDFTLTSLYLQEYAHFTQYSIELSLHKFTPQYIQDLISLCDCQKQPLIIQKQSMIIEAEQIKPEKIMFKSQPSLEGLTNNNHLSRQDSDTYLQIKQKYLSKLSNVPSIQPPIIYHQQIEQEVIHPKIEQAITHSHIESYNNYEPPENMSPNFKQLQVLEEKQVEPEILPTEPDEELKLENGSDIEIDKEFIHEDIKPEWERSQLILNQDEHYRELFETVIHNKTYQTQLHTYTINIKDEKDHSQKQVGDEHFFYKDEWVYDSKKGYLKFINAKKLDAQKKVFKYILSKIGANILKGKSILSISLPVYVFEKRTNLQRFGASFAYAPNFLENVPSNPIKQMAAVISFSLSFTILYLNLEKPFNPILGETCQLWMKGCPVYLEQISHHPPIAAFLMYGRGYKIYGSLESTASFGANTITGGNVGKIVIEFPDTKIEFSYCKGYVSGITYGDRYFYTEGQQIYLDMKNEILGEVYFNPQKKGKNQYDYFEGKMYKVDKNIIQKFKKDKKIKMSNYQCKVLAQIDGNWQQEEVLRVDGVTVFNLMKDLPYKCKPELYPLASDSQYREDLIGWQLDDFELSMEQKEILENRQRRDRKQRV